MIVPAPPGPRRWYPTSRGIGTYGESDRAPDRPCRHRAEPAGRHRADRAARLPVRAGGPPGRGSAAREPPAAGTSL